MRMSMLHNVILKCISHDRYNCGDTAKVEIPKKMMQIHQKVFLLVFFPTMGVRILSKILLFFLLVINILIPILIFPTHFVIVVVYFTMYLTWFSLEANILMSPSEIVLFYPDINLSDIS